MNLKYRNNENLLLSGSYAQIKGKGAKFDDRKELIVTNQRIVHIEKFRRRTLINEIENENIVGYSASYSRKSAIPGLIWLVISIIFGLVYFITQRDRSLFSNPQQIILTAGGVISLIIALVLLLNRPASLTLVIRKETKQQPLFYVGGLVGLAHAITSKKFKVSIKANPSTAKTIVENIGKYLNY